MKINNTVTQTQINDLISESEKTVRHEYGKTTVVSLKLPNGFVIVESSSCVDPANYNPELGESIAMKRIENKVWELEGYRLQCELTRRHECLPMSQREAYARLEKIARTAHEVNRAYCNAIGDNSQLPWDESPEWQRKSAINGVAFHLDNCDVTPEQSHENWMREKAADGWVYGEVKDPAKKEHPCMVPYSELPLSQRIKDVLFKAVVDSSM